MTENEKFVRPRDIKGILENAIVIDVRENAYFLLDHIKNAINVESTERIAYIAQENRDKKILLYCHHGNTAKFIADTLAAQGIDNVYYVKGSFGEIAKSGVEIIYYNKEK